jgi:hypothetical protein
MYVVPSVRHYEPTLLTIRIFLIFIFGTFIKICRKNSFFKQKTGSLLLLPLAVAASKLHIYQMLCEEF